MLIGISVILYGGLLYHFIVMYAFDAVGLLRRFQLEIVVRMWQRDVFGRMAVYVLAILVLLGFQGLVWGFGAGPHDYIDDGGEGEWVPAGANTVVTGYTGEGQSEEAFPDLDHLNLVAANLTLGWNDNDVSEPGPGITPLAPRNQPDSFRLVVRLPDGTEYEGRGVSDANSRLGEIDLTVPRPSEGNITGWVIEVECTDAGDVVGTLGRTWAADNGNDWSLRIEYTYLEWVVPEG
jgi:hypothetical protein